MKKLILIMICVIVLTVFIALNYLLWDRENRIQSFESLNSSKNVSIDALGEQIKRLEDSNKQLQSTINDLKDQNKQLNEKNSQAQLEKLKQDSEIKSKNAVIEKLKHTANMSDFENMIKKWADDIDKGQYDAAYKMINSNNINLTAFHKIDDFTAYFTANIKDVKYKSAKLVTEDVPDDRTGDLIFKVVLDVKKSDNSATNNEVFFNGENTKFFTLTFNTGINDWVISEIATLI